MTRLTSQGIAHTSDESQVAAFSEQIRASVDEHGWAAVAVASEPPFTYTAGLWRSLNHPELIVTGLPAETAKVVLDHAVDEIKRGQPIRDGTIVRGLIGEYPVAARRVQPSSLAQLAFAAELYRGVTFSAIQLVWPDRAGHFPWHIGTAREYRQAQPLLFSTSRLASLIGIRRR